MHFLTRKHLSRRKLLRGAGVSLPLPFLESMVPAGKALAADRGTPASRQSAPRDRFAGSTPAGRSS